MSSTSTLGSVFILNSVMANITTGGQFVPTALIAINCPLPLESSHFHLYIFVPAVLSARNVLPSLLSPNDNRFSKPRSHLTSPTNTLKKLPAMDALSESTGNALFGNMDSQSEMVLKIS